MNTPRKVNLDNYMYGLDKQVEEGEMTEHEAFLDYLEEMTEQRMEEDREVIEDGWYW